MVRFNYDRGFIHFYHEQARGSADMDKEWNEKYNQQDLQRLRGLRLMDDDFMSKCFENNIECTELVLHIVLGRDDLKVEKVETQHFCSM